MQRELKAYKRKHGIHHPLLAVDCENNPADGKFICAGVFGDIKHRTTKRGGKKHVKVTTTKRVCEYFTDKDELCEFLMELKKNACILVFFNLAYDKIYFDSIIDHDTVLQSGTRLIMLTLKNGIKAMDLMNHTPTGTEAHGGRLADWIEYLNMTEKHGVAKAELSDHYERVMNDVKATYYLGVFLEDFYFYECGIPLQCTVGAAAMKLFTMKYFNHYWSRDSDAIALYERRSYYGGRVELFRRGNQKTFAYDVNSMYLSIMRDCKIPDILTGRFVANKIKNWRRYLTDYLGVWNVTVYCPPGIYLPLLPVRIGGKLKFPTGTFTGVWTSMELNRAEELGYKIIEVHDFLYFSRCQLYFHDYALFVWSKRQEYKAKNNLAMDLMIKKIGNALYGKFAQRNASEYFGRVGDFKGDIPDGCQFFDYAGETWLLVKGEASPAKFEFPVVSSFITAYARLKLYDAMLANIDALIYCDTDCIKLTRPAVGITIGKELGEWSNDLSGETIMYRRPKLYGDKRKGVPKRAVLVSRNKVKEVWKFDRPLREREAIKRGLTPNVWIAAEKHLTFLDDKRRWFTNNRSKPLTLTLAGQELGHTEEDYKRYIKKIHAPHFHFGNDLEMTDRLAPGEAGAASLEDLQKRRAGEMLYQR